LDSSPRQRNEDESKIARYYVGQRYGGAGVHVARIVVERGMRSVEITDFAELLLKSEAIKAQSAQVDLVTSATITGWASAKP
jgi:hypothetical protein